PSQSARWCHRPVGWHASSVLEELKASRVEDGLLGSFRFDRNGYISPPSVPIIRKSPAPRRPAPVFRRSPGSGVGPVVEYRRARCADA
ncbi:MAG: hypothetical protein ACRDM7_00390, partial [Thermoleophilaceae bacterium]